MYTFCNWKILEDNEGIEFSFNLQYDKSKIVIFERQL